MSFTCPTCNHPWTDHDPYSPLLPDDLQVGCVHGWGEEDGCDCSLPRVGRTGYEKSV